MSDNNQQIHDYIEKLEAENSTLKVALNKYSEDEILLTHQHRIKVLRGALEMVREIIVKGAVTGFQPLEGTWADELFRSQHDTHKALSISDNTAELDVLELNAERWKHMMNIGVDSKGEFRVDIYQPSKEIFLSNWDAAMKKEQ